MYSTTGIIIKKDNKGEHNQLVTIYTKEYGKISLLSKGVRKGSAKLSGHLLLLHLSVFHFVLGKHQKVLTTVSEIQGFSTLKKDLEKVRAGMHIVELVGTYTMEEEKDEALFHLLLGALDYLNRKEMKRIDVKFFLRYFEFKFLSLLGYEPEDKTIVYALSGETNTLSEGQLDRMETDFGRYFQNIYSKAL